MIKHAHYQQIIVDNVIVLHEQRQQIAKKQIEYDDTNTSGKNII